MAKTSPSVRPGLDPGADTEHQAQRRWKQEQDSERKPETLAAEVAVLWLIRHGVPRNLAPAVAELAGLGGLRR